MIIDKTGLLGRGWAFPIRFSGDGPRMAVDLEDIQQSLHILFSTLPGERIMRPAFGCDLLPLAFEMISDSLVSRLGAVLREAVERHEPRVMVTHVQVKQDARRPSLLQALLQYRVRNADFQGQVTWDVDLGDGQPMRHV